MQRYFIQLAYLGTNFSGWQIQSNANTVQAELERALSTILREDITTTGAGRTDTGVHASFFIAHFDSEIRNLQWDQSVLMSINDVLHRDIAVKKIFAVVPEAHARFSATLRTYQYHIGRTKNPFHNETCWYFRSHLDIDKMKLAADMLLNYSDFSSFSKTGSDVKTHICKISLVLWEEKENQFVFTIRADRFLRNMVRAIVGTLVEVGRGRITSNEFADIIEAKSRAAAGPSAPPQGLFLTNIVYPVELFIE